ncbi:MAG: PqqD family protein [Gemmatimonadota bacterium]|nr:PqqD family protein [Gemmatimonadota bacterium]
MPASPPPEPGPDGPEPAGPTPRPAEWSARPRGRDDVIFRQLSDDWVLFDPSTNQIHVLNLAAALVWTACDGTQAVEDIVEEVAGSYDGPSAREIRDDVEDALRRFRAEGLLA